MPRCLRWGVIFMPLLRDLSIRNKLLLAFGTITLLIGIVGFIAVSINSEIRTDISQIRQAAIENAEAVSTMAESLLELKLYDQELTTERHRATIASESPDFSKIAQDIAETTNEFEGAIALSRKITLQDIEVSTGEGATEEAQKTKEELPLLDDIELKFGQLKKVIQNDVDGANVGLDKEGDTYDQVSDLVETYETDTKNRVGSEVHNIEVALSRANTILLSSVLLILVLGSFLTWFISRTVSHPIEILMGFAQRIGQGDLDATVKLQSQDEFGLLATTFNQMINDLRTKTVSKDYVDSILKSMVNTLIVVRRDHTIQSVNEATPQLLDYPESELIGQSMDRILQTPQSSSQFLLDEAFEKGAVSNVDVIYQTKQGDLIPMSFSASTLRDSTGMVSGLVCVAQDISERKKAERELEQANKQLLETSRQAGMAEVATSVLHNVGNVLNSVNLSSTIISEKVQNSKIASFTKAVALMEEHQADLPGFFAHDEKGRKLPGYLSKLALNLAYEQKEILQEVDSLAGNVLHIKEIVATQQNYARVSGITESLQVADLVEDALRINAGAMERHGVTVVREYSETPSVLIEKHKMLQVLVNLISNAKYACEASGGSNKQLTLRITHGNNRVKISVIDTGVGISKENLTRIFGYGFTTKKEGHGFGLHSSALAAKEMGGTLTASSEGPGYGATFTLELPIQSQK
jgi:PAS domain S-box-containing protein